MAIYDWRIPIGGVFPKGIVAFHAYDVATNLAACSDSAGLYSSDRDPHKEDEFCAECAEIIGQEGVGKGTVRAI